MKIIQTPQARSVDIKKPEGDARSMADISCSLIDDLLVQPLVRRVAYPIMICQLCHNSKQSSVCWVNRPESLKIWSSGKPTRMDQI